MNHAQIVADLKAAKALIDTPEKWTQGAYARSSIGVELTYHNKEASCFCSWGALANVKGSTGSTYEALRFLDSFTTQDNIVQFNDLESTTHAEVMAVWDKAIAKAEALVIVQNLEAARAKIEKPEQWTQGTSARDSEGRSVGVYEGTATCFCTFGALRAVATYQYKALSFLREAVDMNPITFNDTFGREHEEVLAMFDRAIQLAKEAAEAV